MEGIHNTYYHNQAFGGGNTGPYFVGSFNYQRGSGIGSFLPLYFGTLNRLLRRAFEVSARKLFQQDRKF